MNWLEKNKGHPLAMVCFESNLVDIPSNTWCLATNATIHVTNKLQEFTARRTFFIIWISLILIVVLIVRKGN